MSKLLHKEKDTFILNLIFGLTEFILCFSQGIPPNQVGQLIFDRETLGRGPTGEKVFLAVLLVLGIL